MIPQPSVSYIKETIDLLKSIVQLNVTVYLFVRITLCATYPLRMLIMSLSFSIPSYIIHLSSSLNPETENLSTYQCIPFTLQQESSYLYM